MTSHIPAVQPPPRRIRRRRPLVFNSVLMLMFGGAAALFLTAVPNSAEAIPTFARQISAPCSTCHTQQPRLNRFGTEFKLGGWQMSTRATIPMGDEHTIFESLPVSARFRGNFAARSGDDHDGTEKSLTLPNDDGLEGNGIEFFVAGKIADGIGIFGDGDVRVNVNQRFGNMLVGIIGGQMRPGAGDPFDTIGGGRMMAYTQNRDFVFNAGPENNDPWRTRGKGANAFVAIDDFYFAGGWWGLDEGGGTAPSTTLDLENKSDMVFLRAVYRPAIGATNSHIGFHSSRISVLEMERYGIDAASQIPLDTGFANMLDVIGVITGGKDSGESHQGYQISTALLRNKLSYGLQVGYYDRVQGDATNIGAHVSYLIRPNIRVYTELHRDSISDNGTDRDNNFFTIGFDSDW
jgi:hypothetical protein